MAKPGFPPFNLPKRPHDFTLSSEKLTTPNGDESNQFEHIIVNDCLLINYIPRNTHLIKSYFPDTENKSPNRRSPLNQASHVTFDERREEKNLEGGQQINHRTIAEPETTGEERNELDKRRTSLKTGGSEVRTDSVESNEVSHLLEVFLNQFIAKKI